MDIKNEDTIVRQIEKNLSNNINENLFLTGRVYDNKTQSKKNAVEVKEVPTDLNSTEQDYPLVSYDYINNTPTTISRAEYIRQAREACLRQLSNTQVYSRPYDVNYMEPEATVTEQPDQNKTNTLKLFEDKTQEAATKEINSPQELAAFRSLIIRTVCAIVLFISVFIIDKYEITIRKLTPDMIQEYVTGKDTLQELENTVITWLK